MIKLFRDLLIGTDSGGPDPIPEDVRKKIEDEYHDTFAGRIKKAAAQFGYSLSLPTIQAQEERIRVLEEALRKVRAHTVDVLHFSEDGSICKIINEAISPFN